MMLQKSSSVIVNCSLLLMMMMIPSSPTTVMAFSSNFGVPTTTATKKMPTRVQMSTTEETATTADDDTLDRFHKPPDIVEAETRQASYGAGTDLPDTYVKCGRCQTVYAFTPADIGERSGRRLECAVCKHSWFQSKDRIMDLRDEFFELQSLPERDHERIAMNIKESKAPRYTGECKLYVCNIAFNCHEEDLYEVFAQKDRNVGDVSLVRDDDGRNRGFGFVTMRTDADGDAAIEDLDGTCIRGRAISVRTANN